ncbi:hypothetical protein CANARDRAFT_9207 [[Candida] arabinofermentans NRRL YB-2248]|uniref:Peptidase M20 dimerisation domain-containing protein n=1 Tax=[Candida] arabinofermentans NRRL YB-2248 TaxID=983967 RepID=A0A1E4SWP8_9ASCO|nr:hypothetical protein CANARDRAFT_9207 [[Candida] arabinofermentans NRRL YB-2248]
MSEKLLPQSTFDGFAQRKPSTAWKKSLATFAILSAASASVWLVLGHNCLKFNSKSVSTFNSYAAPPDESLCPSFPQIAFTDIEQSKFILNDESFRNVSALKLSKAVQYDTQVDDGDPDFTKFEGFHKVLEEQYPTVFGNATIFKPNKYGLVLEFKGSDESLQPIVLMAHQDTVPIGDMAKWTRDPLGGEYDGEKVYGRGAMDCKNLLVGCLGAMEQVLASGYKLKRTVTLTFGFDEEINGYRGAKHNAEFLIDRYGEKNVYQVIDEGSPAFLKTEDKYFSNMGTSEKGYFDIAVDVVAPGGHSSIPYDHTSIGYISKFIVGYEDDQFSPVMPNISPMLGNLQCLAEHADINASLKSDILKAHLDEASNKRVLDYMTKDRLTKYLVQTSQAVDIIEGGEKINSLPRNTTVIINHRIAIGDSPQDVMDKIVKHATIVAKKFNLGLIVDGTEVIPTTEEGFFNVRPLYILASAPITPAFDELWEKFAGHIRYFYEELVHPELFTDESSQIIIGPGLMTANTDTRHYWDVSDHIFRWQPGFDGLEAGIHNVNEYIHIDTHLQVIAFYFGYILGIC